MPPGSGVEGVNVKIAPLTEHVPATILEPLPYMPFTIARITRPVAVTGLTALLNCTTTFVFTKTPVAQAAGLVETTVNGVVSVEKVVANWLENGLTEFPARSLNPLT